MLFFVRSEGPSVTYRAHALRTPADADLYARAMQDGTSVDSNDITSWKQAEEVAASIEGPVKYMAVDKGAMNEWPRYDVVRAWKIGDHVKMVFHGDGFDCGLVCRVSKDAHRVRVTGRAGPRGGRKPLTFKRVGRSGVWKCGAFHLEHFSPHPEHNDRDKR